jgi:hypothetical protein
MTNKQPLPNFLGDFKDITCVSGKAEISRSRLVSADCSCLNSAGRATVVRNRGNRGMQGRVERRKVLACVTLQLFCFSPFFLSL